MLAVRLSKKQRHFMQIVVPIGAAERPSEIQPRATPLRCRGCGAAMVTPIFAGPVASLRVHLTLEDECLEYYREVSPRVLVGRYDILASTISLQPAANKSYYEVAGLTSSGLDVSIRRFFHRGSLAEGNYYSARSQAQDFFTELRSRPHAMPMVWNQKERQQTAKSTLLLPPLPADV